MDQKVSRAAVPRAVAIALAARPVMAGGFSGRLEVAPAVSGCRVTVRGPKPGKSARPGELFAMQISSGGSLLTGTDPNSLGRRHPGFERRWEIRWPRSRTIVTGMDDPFGAIPQQVLEAPSLPSGLRSARFKTSGSGNGWAPGRRGKHRRLIRLPPETVHPQTTPGTGGYRRPATVTKTHPSGDLPGQTQSAPYGLGNGRRFSGIRALASTEQAVPETGHG